MVPGDEAAIAVHAFVALLGALVFFARPGGALNRVLGALLVLRGTARIFAVLSTGAASYEDARLYHAVNAWYMLPTPFLTFLFIHYLLPPERPAAWRRWGLAAVAAVTLLLTPMAAVDPPLVREEDGSYVHGDYVWDVRFALFTNVAHGFAIVAAGFGAATAWRGALQRRQAALIGIALLFQFWGPISRTLRNALAFDLAPWADARAWSHLALTLAAAWAAPRLLQPFEGATRRAAAGLVATGFLVGAGYALPQYFLGDGAVIRLLDLLGWGAYAACVALAVVRYDLVGMGSAMRRRIGATTQAMLVFGLLLLPAGFVLAYLGVGSAGLVVALALGGGALALSPAPMRALTRGLARIFAPDPADPEVAAERARRYADALDRAPDDEAALARLRVDLGLPEAEHRALSRLVARRHASGAARSPPILGRYVVERELGRGAFGTAVLAHDLATGGRVVLKWFHAAWGEKRALAEAQALAKVRHARVVPLLAVERAGDRVFLVLAYVEGGTLHELLAQGPLPPERAARLLDDVLEGLEAVHAAGLAHGDVKPANVLLDAEGRALVADLGAAQALARPDADLTITVAPVVGSYATVAPEVLRGGRRTAAADVYAAGAVLYKMLAGDDYVPLAGRDVVSMTDTILHAPPRLPHPRVPAPLEPVLRRALAKAPHERYASAGEMRRALADATR